MEVHPKRACVCTKYIAKSTRGERGCLPHLRSLLSTGPETDLSLRMCRGGCWCGWWVVGQGGGSAVAGGRLARSPSQAGWLVRPLVGSSAGYVVAAVVRRAVVVVVVFEVVAMAAVVMVGVGVKGGGWASWRRRPRRRCGGGGGGGVASGGGGGGGCGGGHGSGRGGSGGGPGSGRGHARGRVGVRVVPIGRVRRDRGRRRRARSGRGWKEVGRRRRVGWVVRRPVGRPSLSSPLPSLSPPRPRPARWCCCWPRYLRASQVGVVLEAVVAVFPSQPRLRW